MIKEMKGKVKKWNRIRLLMVRDMKKVMKVITMI